MPNKIGLREHLQRAEIEWVANQKMQVNGITYHGGKLETFKFDTDIEAHLRRLGFRIKRKWNGAFSDQEPIWWVETTNGISVCLDDRFIVGK